MNIKHKLSTTAKAITYGIALTASGFAIASDDTTSTAQELSERLRILTGITVISAEAAPIDGFLQLVTESGIFYASENGEHIFSGALHNFENGFHNLTEERFNVVKAASIKKYEDTFITYEAPNQVHEIVVFYDSTCPFCTRMHQQVDSYLEQGITVHYAAFPRGGVNAPSANELNNIFCADDSQSALNNSLSNTPIAPATCSNPNLIAEHYALGNQLGVNGTPAIYTLHSGEALEGGAIPAPTLRGRLDAL